MSAEKIISEWKKGQFKPVYWLEGEESYFIDQVVHYAEKKRVPPSDGKEPVAYADCPEPWVTT